MAKATKTTAQKEAEAGRAAFQKAKDAHDKTPNATTKAAMEKAQTVMRAANDVENKERFVTVGRSRTVKARAAIRQLVKITNPKTYSSTQEQRETILKGLAEAYNDVKTAFANVGAKSAENHDSFAL